MALMKARAEAGVLLAACFAFTRMAVRRPNHLEHGAEPCFQGLPLQQACLQARAGPGSSCLCLQAALDLFETQWDQLVGKPSTITSPEDQQVRSVAGM